MNKKIKIIISIIVFVLILLITAGGIFWWKWKSKTYIKTISKRVYVNSEEYEIKEAPEGKILENKKEGLVVRIPNGWIVKQDEGGIGIFSPEIEFDQYGGFLKSVREKGACVVGITISKCEKVDPEVDTDAEIIKRYVIMAQEDPEEMSQEGYEVTKVDDYLALKEIHRQEGEVRYILVEIPINNTIYSFDSGLIFSEKCLQEFNKILETVSIE